MHAEAEGALEAFVSVISGPPGPRPEAIFDRVSGPILLLWGQRDTVTPLDGPVGKFMKAAADSRPQTQFKILQGNRALQFTTHSRKQVPKLRHCMMLMLCRHWGCIDYCLTNEIVLHALYKLSHKHGL